MIPGYVRCSKTGCETVRPVKNMFYSGGNLYCFHHISSAKDRPAGRNHPLERVSDILECGNVMAGLLALYAIGEVFEDY